MLPPEGGTVFCLAMTWREVTSQSAIAIAGED